MASVTRSTRRAESLHKPHHRRRRRHSHYHPPHPHHHHNHPPLPYHLHPRHGSLTRSKPVPSGPYCHEKIQKRALQAEDSDSVAVHSKRTRITLNLRPKSPPADGAGLLPASVPLPPPAAAGILGGSPQQATKRSVNSTATYPPARRANGSGRDLNWSQPPPVDLKKQGRKLRSQEATRFKSELSAYFPDYDEVIGNDPKEQHLLNLETPIVVVDTNPRRALAPELQHGFPHIHLPNLAGEYPVRGYGDSLFTDVSDSQRIDFRFLETQQNIQDLTDPLPDDLFEPSHRRAERLERSIRNSEKGRAQHEKDQVMRLLEGLHGHDWLRVMGVSGITETKKKTYEPARAFFIKGCQAILEKFRIWNMEEKRRKLERDRAIAASSAKEQMLEEEEVEDEVEAEEEEEEEEEEVEEEDDDDADEGEEVLESEEGEAEVDPQVDDEGDSNDEEAEEEEGEVAAEEEEEDDDDDDGDESNHNSNNNNSDDDEGETGEMEVENSDEEMAFQDDASEASSPAKQLLQEALARSRLAAGKPTKTRLTAVVPKSPEAPPQEITSFFRKRYERDGALNRNRRTGRKVLAWGHPLPDMAEADFALPEVYRGDETLKSRARRKRRDKRGFSRA